MISLFSIRRTFGCVLLLACIGSVVANISADERILSFDSDILVAPDGSMTVIETIQVKVEGKRIKRGIYRDFPTEYKDRYGNNMRVDFAVLGVNRDGTPETYSASKLDNGVRIRIGKADVLLNPGVYTYSIRYLTGRQLGFFADHDELYWNVTGNGWDFSIDQVSASVRLPGAVSASALTMEAYTGRTGSKGQDYSTSVADGRASVQSTRVLTRKEGLTLVLSWPKGVIIEPSATDRAHFFLRDNLGVLISLLALLASGVFLFVSWNRYGRDPKPGVIFPHYEPPKGYSPASARYISKMTYDNTATSAAVVNLAVKGYLEIKNTEDEYSLGKTALADQASAQSKSKLAPGEQALLEALFEKNSFLELKPENRATIVAAQGEHLKALQEDYRNIYFKINAALLLPTFVGSMLAAGLVFVFDAFVPAVIALVAANFLLHVLFLYLMKAPTPRGRLVMDKLEGFKQYLEVAEKDDLNLRYSPALTPEIFERFLPFAMALGVEQAWAERFTRVFAALSAEQNTNYHPAWYAGSFHHLHMSGFAKGIGSGFESAIASAATPPGSSSGAGGGGFSGGGGGGGGGGGW